MLKTSEEEEMAFNSVSLAGNATRDAEIRATKSGSYAVSFGIAVNEWTGGEDRPNFFDVTAFATSEKQRDFYGSIRKGERIAVQGRLRQDTWEAKDGTSRSKVVVIASEIFKAPSSNALPAAEPADGGLWDEELPF